MGKKTQAQTFPEELLVGYEALLGEEAYPVILQVEDVNGLPNGARVGRYTLAGVVEVEQSFRLVPVTDRTWKAAR